MTVAKRFSPAVDCGACVGWCCTVYEFERFAGFGADKPAGQRCVHLTPGYRCAVYVERARRGYTACVGYTCYGAGARLTAAWRQGLFTSEAKAGRAYFSLHALCEVGFFLEKVAEVGLVPTDAEGGGWLRLYERVLAALRPTAWDSPEAVACVRDVGIWLQRYRREPNVGGPRLTPVAEVVRSRATVTEGSAGSSVCVPSPGCGCSARRGPAAV